MAQDDEDTPPAEPEAKPDKEAKPEKKAKAEKKAKPEKKAKSEKKAKPDKKARGKRGGKDEPAPYSSIATHPRARASVRKAKGWTGLIAFAIAAGLSLNASVPLVQVGARALAAGIVGYLLAWWFSMMIWRQLMLAEQRAAVAELERRREEGEAQGAEAQAAG